MVHEFGAMDARELLDDALPFGRQVDLHTAAIGFAGPAFDKAKLLAAGNQRDRAVVMRL